MTYRLFSNRHFTTFFTLSFGAVALVSPTILAPSVATAQSDTDKLKDLAAEKATAIASEKTRNYLNPYFDHLELNVSGGQRRKPEGNLIGVKAYDDDGRKNSFIFNQFGINRYDSRTTLNIGLGFRHLTSDEKWLLGANVFYDHELPNDHQRSGAGVELRSSVLRLTANSYSGISGYKTDKSGTDSKSLSGNDAKFEISLPYLPGAKLTYRAFKWEGIDGASDSKGNTVGLKGYLTENLLIEAGRTNFTGTSSASSRNEISLSYKFRFGENSEAKVYNFSGKAYELKPIGSSRYEPVDRENRIIKQKKFGTTVSGV
jgi:adhesin/invasin